MTCSRALPWLCAFLLASPGLASAQGGQYQTLLQQQTQQQMLGGGVGATWIDGKAYYLINLSPQFNFGRLGIGTDINLRFEATTGKLRSQDYQKAGDYLRMVRYVQWANKGDPLYVKVGMLDYSQLGYGLIMYNYCNSSSYDLRKWGGELGMNREKGGFEAIYSDLLGRYGKGVAGLRGFVRPLKFTSAGDVPLLGRIVVGATYAADFNSDAEAFHHAAVASPADTVTRRSTLSIYGADAGLPIISGTHLNSTLYYNVAKIVDFGQGAAAGIDLNVNGGGLLSVGAKYERRFLGDQFIASYFDALYEQDRYSLGGRRGFISKADTLENARASQGYYGELRVTVLNEVNVLGGYYAPLGVRDQGTFHAVAEAPKLIPSVLLRGGYDRNNIGQLFKADQNSLLYGEVGYWLNRFMVLSTVYEWTYVPDPNHPGHLVTQRRIEPKLSFQFNV